MISAQVGDVLIVWEDGKAETLGGSELAQERIRRLFEKPAQGRVSAEIEGGGIEQRFEKLAPGSAAHARAVIASIRGSLFLLDNESR